MSAMIIAGLQLLIVIVARKVSLMKSMLTLPLLLLLVPNMIVMAEIVMMLIRVMMMTMVLADAGHGRLDTFSADAYAQLFMVVSETMMTGSTRAGAKCSASSGSVLVDLTATTTSWHRA